MCVRNNTHIVDPHRHTQGSNGFGPEGAGKLAGALGQMTGMQKLFLVSIGLRSRGVCMCV